MGTSQRLTLTEFIAWILKRRERFNVRGLSMQPLLQPGDDVLLKQYAAVKEIEVGDIIIVTDPRTIELKEPRLLVKRVSHIESDQLFVEGDNTEHSTDSHQFGVIPFELVKGKVTVVL